ncbi:hypothetical protein RHO12_03350 [Orbus sturtevantii]|uniref:DUF7446 family protein n=1 Tax=Orbus sturtevantii TaxID=3074109 RepID=UPI00370D9E29
MGDTVKLQLGYSPLTNKIYLAKMKDFGNGTKVRIGKERQDVTNEAAMMVWELVRDNGGSIHWELDDGTAMVLKAEFLNEDGKNETSYKTKLA